MNADKVTVLFGHGLTGWALYATALGIGIAETSFPNALMIHAIAAPICFAIVSFVYFRFFHYTRPLGTALIFLGISMALDFFLVGLVVRQSLDLFASLLGTWIPFGLIFATTYVTGSLVARGNQTPQNTN